MFKDFKSAEIPPDELVADWIRECELDDLVRTNPPKRVGKAVTPALLRLHNEQPFLASQLIVERVLGFPEGSLDNEGIEGVLKLVESFSDFYNSAPVEQPATTAPFTLPAQATPPLPA